MFEQLSKTDMMRLEENRMVESIKLGMTPDEIKKLWDWSTAHYNALYRQVYDEIKDYVQTENPQNLDEEIMNEFRVNVKPPKVKPWTDPRDGKTWYDVSEFWGI